MIGSPLAGTLGPLGVGRSAGIPTPAAYWTMDEAAGVSRADSIGSNHLSQTGSVSQVAGLVGNAARIPASGANFLSAPASSVLDGGGDVDLTIALWVKLNGKGSDQSIVFKGTGTGAAGLEYRLLYLSSGDRLRWIVSRNVAATAVDANALGSPSTGVWYFVVCDHNAAANTISIRTNELTANTAAHAGIGIHTTAGAFRVGRADAGTPGNCDVDELGLWRTVLSDAHVSYLYNGGSGRTYPYT